MRDNIVYVIIIVEGVYITVSELFKVLKQYQI